MSLLQEEREIILANEYVDAFDFDAREGEQVIEFLGAQSVEVDVGLEPVE